jgi:hypothetical protein
MVRGGVPHINEYRPAFSGTQAWSQERRRDKALSFWREAVAASISYWRTAAASGLFSCGIAVSCMSGFCALTRDY